MAVTETAGAQSSGTQLADAQLISEDVLADELSGLDNLEMRDATRPGLLRRTWKVVWPKVLAVGLALGAWQIVVWSGWRPEYVLPSPATVLARLWNDLGPAETWQAVTTTLRRAGTGFGLAVVIGGALGAAVSASKTIRSGLGSLITGLQTMPSIAWFPLALLLFGLSEPAILFVVILGAAPAVANGVISGISQVPVILLRAGRSLGATGLRAYRHVIIPAALPSVMGGLKSGWAFAWRSLLAGELLVIIASKPSIGASLEFQREFADTPGMLAVMLLILIIGILIDSLGFSIAERAVLRRRGLHV